MGKVMFHRAPLFPEKRKNFPGKTVKHDKLFERMGENRMRAVLIPKKMTKTFSEKAAGDRKTWPFYEKCTKTKDEAWQMCIKIQELTQKC